MKIHEYNEMMAYLTRPSYVSGGRVGFADGTPARGLFKKEVIQIYNDLIRAGKKVFTRDIAERVTTSKMTGDALKSQIAEYLKRENLPYEKSDLGRAGEARVKAAETIKQIKRVENFLPDIKKAELFADIRKYRSGPITGPDATMKIKEFAEYFPKGTSDVVISRQINRVANDVLKLSDHPVKGKAGELAAKRTKYEIMKTGDPEGRFAKITKEPGTVRHHMRAKGIKLGNKIIAISPSLADISRLDAVTNSVKLQESGYEQTRNAFARELLELRENKPEGWQRRREEINALVKRESRKIPKHLRPYLFFETMDEVGNLKPIGGWKTKAIDPTSTTPFDATTRAVPAVKKEISKAIPSDKPGLWKTAKKGLGKTLLGAATPLGAGALWAGTGGVDLKSGVDRATLGAELGFAPELVKISEKVTKTIKNPAVKSTVQRGLNLFLNPATAMRAAKIVSPLGWAALAGEGAYQGGKFMYRDYQKRKDAVEKMWKEDPEEMNRLALEVSETMRDDTSTMFNQGGRVGLAKGPKDPGRRLFIKGVAAASLIPIIGKYFKLAAPATKAAAQYTGPVLEGLGSKLKWVQLLAKRLWDEGADVTETAGTAERQIVKRGTLESGDEVDMVYDVNTKDVRFEVNPKKNPKTGLSTHQTEGGAYEQSYQLDYRAPQVIEEGVDAGKKTKAEIEVAESTPRQVSPEDVELDADVNTVEDAISDLTELEAFAKKKTVKEIHKIKGTTPKDTNPTWEPSDYYDLDYDID